MNRRWLLACVALLAPLTLLAAKDERWLRVSNPEFTVITSLPEREAKTWAGEFAQYLAALRALFRNDERRLPPLTIVLFTREKDFQRYRPVNEKGKALEMDGFFLRHESWAVAGLAGAQQSTETRRLIFHEGVHWFLSSTTRPNPVWLEEGIAELFSTFNVTAKEMEWGRPIENHVALLRYEARLPMEQLLATARGDLFGDDSLRTSIVYAQSWAFVHFVLFGRHELPRDGLTQFLDEVQKGTLQRDAFRTAFKRDYGQMDDLLGQYVRAGQHYVRRVPLLPVPAATAEPATAVDVDNALARLGLAAQRWDLAATHARAAVAAAPDDPRGHEALGLVLKGQDQAAAAMAEFQLAIDKGSRDFQPYFEVAATLQNEAFGSLGLGSMDVRAARRVANYYERAINLRPRFLGSYQNLAGVIGVAEPWGPDDRDFLELGAKLFPDDGMIRLGLAILTHRSGKLAEARAQLTDVLRNEDLKNSVRSYGRRLEDAWESEAVLQELDKLLAAQNAAETLAFVEKQLATNLSRPLEAQLLQLQKQLRGAVQAQAFDEALRARNWAEARKIGNDIFASNAPLPLKNQVRRTLEDLDRRKLGAPKD